MPATLAALLIAILFFVPGVILDFMLARWNPRPKRDANEILLAALTLSALNYIVWLFVLVPLALIAERQGWQNWLRGHPLTASLLAVGILCAAPVIEGLIIGNLLRLERFRRWVNTWFGFRPRTAPKGWDWVFGQDRDYLALVTLTDDTIIGVGWGRNSVASQFPSEEDVYFEVVYSLNDDGSFGDPARLSEGLLLKRSDIRSIELFDVEIRGRSEAPYVG